MVERPRLFMLPPSHYCERARWALDYVALDYQEERLAVGLHILRARSMAQATTLPILTSGRAIIQGSGAILDFVGMAGGAYELERRFEDRIGVLVRQFLYAGTLGLSSSGVGDVLLDGVPAGPAS